MNAFALATVLATGLIVVCSGNGAPGAGLGLGGVVLLIGALIDDHENRRR
jgi:hypothetical protein